VRVFSLSAVLEAESAAAEDEHHGMLALQLGELPALRRVIGKFVVGEDDPWNNVRSHMKSRQFDGGRINLLLHVSEISFPIQKRIEFGRPGELDLVEPAGALGVFIDELGLADQRLVYTKDFAFTGDGRLSRLSRIR
jgi:hypothetical protein